MDKHYWKDRALTAEREARELRARVARVEALVDEWDAATTTGTYWSDTVTIDKRPTLVPDPCACPPLGPVSSDCPIHGNDRCEGTGHFLAASEPAPINETSTKD